MPWLNNNNILKNIKNLGIPHESNGAMFDIMLSIDPNESETHKFFNIPRPIYENVDKICDKYDITNEKIKDFINYSEGENVPIFGSFGFGFSNKGFDKIIKIVNNNYDAAIIKLVITFAHFDPNRDANINHVLQMCNSIIRKPNVKLMILTDFLTNEEVLLFLKFNTCNIFLYDKMEGRGTSSVIDYAISVNKPFVISDSFMFRHIYSDKICVYKTNIKDAIENSKKMLPILLKKYSNKNLIDKIDSVINILNNTNKIFDYNVSAYYHSENYKESANVTDKLLVLFNSYKNNNMNTFKVSNDIFTDTCINVVKTLFINVDINNKKFEINFKEHEEVSWNDILNKINKHLDTIKEKNLIEVSIGEIIDKYSILELKQKYISDANKLQDIKNEMNTLKDYVADITTTHFYKMLLYINQQIWLDTDIIKGININININVNDKDLETICKLTEIYNRIFDNNQRRFRLKNHFNTVKKSYIKEHKSYAENSCLIVILEESDIYDKIPEINYLCISYDIIYFNHSYKNIIDKLFINTNIKFIEVCDVVIDSDQKTALKVYDLQSFTINTDTKDFFDFIPIKYKSPGKFGDFLNQLSVICENYYKTGRKGDLYIYDLEHIGDKFIFGIEDTYADTYNIIMSLNFIKNYKIYNNEAIDVNLSMWRNYLNVAIPNKENWFHIYSKVYDINWGKHTWLKSQIDPTWNDKIIINITPYRFILQNCIVKLIDAIKDRINDCIFISNEKGHYDYFCKNTGLNIEYYKPQNFQETVTIINSCKIGYFGLSSMAVIANALHKSHYLICQNNIDYDLNNMKDIIPHVLDILV
jgi:hypothetical protein